MSVGRSLAALTLKLTVTVGSHVTLVAQDEHVVWIFIVHIETSSLLLAIFNSTHRRYKRADALGDRSNQFSVCR